MWLEILVANLATNFQDLVAKVKNLVALAPVLGAILRLGIIFEIQLFQRDRYTDLATSLMNMSFNVKIHNYEAEM